MSLLSSRLTYYWRMFVTRSMAILLTSPTRASLRCNNNIEQTTLPPQIRIMVLLLSKILVPYFLNLSIPIRSIMSNYRIILTITSTGTSQSSAHLARTVISFFPSNFWIIDIDASNHICSSLASLIEYSPYTSLFFLFFFSITCRR